MRDIFKLLPILFLMGLHHHGTSQVTSIDSVEGKQFFQGCIKPYIIPSHPLGLFISRINHNLNTITPQTIKFNLDIGSANVWLPEVRLYQPNDPNIAKHLGQFNWDKRDSIFQAFPRNYDSAVFSADGVIKTFHLNIRFPLPKQFELAVSIRSMLLTQGNLPLSAITGDEFIEFFHSNIAGGEDPFARKYYGINKAGINYQDFQGNRMQISNGQFIIPNIQFNLYHYFNTDFLNRHQMSVNSGVHCGINVSDYNQSIDVGISGAIQKFIKLSDKRTLALALAGSALKPQIALLKTKANFSTAHYFLAYEAMVEYRRQFKNRFFWQIGLNFNYQSAYNNEAEFNSVVPIGNRISPHWHLAFTHMYRNNQNWTLITSLGKKWIWSFYLNEDFKVNNAPDIQTGIGVEIPFEKKKQRKK